jgi:adenosylcobinamide-GDP ribazoletransferase
VREWMHRTAVAFAFMTRLPVPLNDLREGDLGRASVLFPLVGLVVATGGVAARMVVEPLWGQATGSVVGVLTVVALTGAFHEDGLADSADGLWGGWEPEQRLAIMRDSRLGTYGTIALLGLFALRFALLVPAPLSTFAVAMVSGHVLGRASGLLLVRLAPSVSGSSSSELAEAVHRGDAVVAGALTIVPVAVAAGTLTVPLLLVAVTVTMAAAHMFRRRLGGVTGDALGATTVVVEVAVLATVLAWNGAGGTVG